VACHNPHPFNLTDEEIREIARSGGAVGVIFMTHLLDENHPRNGLDAIWRTIEHIVEVTNSWDHVALGSDFDGFTDPPDDVPDASAMGNVTATLLERGVPDDALKKVLGGNALRVLQDGWV
jgi:membrane dipeptidase